MKSGTPGLIKREIAIDDGDQVLVRELWDVRAPGCPMIVFDPDVEVVERTIWMHRIEAKERGLLTAPKREAEK